MESPFAHLLELLAGIEDPRRAEGKLYKLPHVLLFSILAVMAGANSYRGIHSFVEVHLARLKESFGLAWRRAPAYTTIRNVLQGLAGREGFPLAWRDLERKRRLGGPQGGRLRRQDPARQLRPLHRQEGDPPGERFRHRKRARPWPYRGRRQVQ